MPEPTRYDRQPADPQPVKPPRFQWTFSLGSLLWLMLVVGILLAWVNDRRQFDARLRKIEQLYQPQVQQTLWSASDVLGAPDDTAGNSGKSWCPQSSAAADWVEVSYDRAVAATSIDIYETYSLGCITEVLVTDGYGNVTSIWKGSDPTVPATSPQAGLFNVPIPAAVKGVQRVKIHVGSVGKSPWPCIDAVGLKTSGGKVTWATSSSCSTVYGGGALTATAKKKGVWTSWW